MTLHHHHTNTETHCVVVVVNISSYQHILSPPRWCKAFTFTPQLPNLLGDKCLAGKFFEGTKAGCPESDSDSKTRNSDKILTTFYWKFWLNSNQILENSDYKSSCLDWRWYYIHTHRDRKSVTKHCFYKIRLPKRKYCKVNVVILNGAKTRTIC